MTWLPLVFGVAAAVAYWRYNAWYFTEGSRIGGLTWLTEAGLATWRPVDDAASVCRWDEYTFRALDYRGHLLEWYTDRGEGCYRKIESAIPWSARGRALVRLDAAVKAQKIDGPKLGRSDHGGRL